MMLFGCVMLCCVMAVLEKLQMKVEVSKPCSEALTTYLCRFPFSTLCCTCPLVLTSVLVLSVPLSMSSRVTRDCHLCTFLRQGCTVNVKSMQGTGKHPELFSSAFL